MLVSWLLFPLLLLALSVGCGLLVKRASGTDLPALLVAPVGFTVIVLVGEMTSIASFLADLAAPLAVGLAVAGFLLAWGGRPGRGEARLGLDGFALAAALGTFAVYAAPVVFSGEPTFTGYIKLDDTATWLALTDRVAEAGRDLSGLAPSTYEATLDFNLGSGYPIGAFTPLAIGSTLIGRDPAWVFQPYLATMALLLALCLYQLTGELVRRPPLRAAIAFLAAQPALLFGYYLWGGVKEIAAALLLALLAALVPAAVSAERFTWRAGIPSALAAAAVIAVLTAAGSALWLLPMLMVGAVALAFRSGGRVTVGRLAVVVGLALLVSMPWLLDAGLLPEEPGALSDPAELGNLTGPLSGWQAFGIWPSGDFRLHPADSLATIVLVGVAVLACLIGLHQVWRRRALGVAAFASGLVVGSLALIAVGSPWVDGKALATCSPAILFVACVGGAALWERGMRIEGGAVLALIALGVLWSNALGYREAFLAPFDRLSELERIGEAIEDEGPTLMTEYEPYGARHFLRLADPESASELRRRLVPLRSGRSLETGDTADVDEFSLEGLLPYRTLVVRRSPLASRPPLPFQLTRAGDDYEVWQADSTPPPLEHLALQEGLSHLGTASCAEIQELAASPGTVHLAAAERPAAAVIPIEQTTFELAEPGTYGVWLGGSSRGDVEIRIDGRAVAASGPEIDHAEQYRQLGSVHLPAGQHEIELAYEEASPLEPGTGGEEFTLGPIVLSSATAAEARVELVDPGEAESLCGRPLDWVEALPY